MAQLFTSTQVQEGTLVDDEVWIIGKENKGDSRGTWSSYILALGKGPDDEVLVIKRETWIANTLCNSMGIYENGTTKNGKDARRK
jgi:hypothetical protein